MAKARPRYSAEATLSRGQARLPEEGQESAGLQDGGVMEARHAENPLNGADEGKAASHLEAIPWL